MSLCDDKLKKEIQAGEYNVHSALTLASLILFEWSEDFKEAGSDRCCRFQGIMLTPAASINNSGEERSDPPFSALLPFSILSVLSSRPGLHCHFKIPLSLIWPRQRVWVKPNESITTWVCGRGGQALFFSLNLVSRTLQTWRISHFLIDLCV